MEIKAIEIPGTIYGIVKRSYWEGREVKEVVFDHARSYEVIKISDGGYAGYSGNDAAASFRLWKGFPEKRNPDSKQLARILTIKRHETGEWEVGKGRIYRDQVQACFYSGCRTLEDPLMQIASHLVEMASRFACDSGCQRRISCDRDLNPYGDYSKPPKKA